MRKYTKEEIAAFNRKDKRISIQGLVQVIIKTVSVDLEDDSEKIVALAKKYSDEIQRVVEEGTTTESEVKNDEVEKKWAEVQFEGPVPTKEEKEILEVIWKKAKTITWPDLLDQIIKEFGQYPSKMSSVSKVLTVLNR